MTIIRLTSIRFRSVFWKDTSLSHILRLCTTNIHNFLSLELKKNKKTKKKYQRAISVKTGHFFGCRDSNGEPMIKIE